MTIDPKAVEAVKAGIKEYNLRGDFQKLRLSPSQDEIREAEAAIHAYHQYLKGIEAKVLVPGKSSEITKPQTVFYDGDDMMRRVAYKRFEDGTIETEDGCDYAADLDVFVELSLSDES